MKKNKNTIIYQIVLLFLVGCQSSSKISNDLVEFSEPDYLNVVEIYTGGAQEYDGLQNTIEFHATLLNSKTIEAQTLRTANMLQWKKVKYEEELQSRLIKAKASTEVFVSFFTPDRKNNDLSRSETLWKIFLVTNGIRYEGKAEKVALLNSEIQSLYPHHNRWSNAYLIKFQVPVLSIEDKASEFIITGPVGSKSIFFIPKQ